MNKDLAADPTVDENAKVVVGQPISQAYFNSVGRIGDTPEAYRVRAMESALREIVRLQDISDQCTIGIECGQRIWQAVDGLSFDEYCAQLSAAWDAAREALK